MIISYNWLKEYINPKVSPEELSTILTDIGLEVEHSEKIESVRGGLKDLIVGQVITCTQHPNADRLRLTQVDTGNGNLLSIVCGAPNVAIGQKVVVAPIDSTIYPTQSEPFKIKKAKIRGELSEGMICAEDEIGLGNSHEGVMVLPDEVPIGTLASTYFNIESDLIFEIGLTPNRSDAASHLGVARDLSAYFKIPIECPNVDLPSAITNTPSIKTTIENNEACPRYSNVFIEGVSVQESPQWLKNKLKAIGIKPINNIVDITNFILHDIGQPLHAFDADLIEGKQIIVKACPEGTPFMTLDNIERKLSASDLMICDAQKPIAMAGILGGLHSGISTNTKNIFIESAYFNPVWIRKTSKKHGIKTDASFRFERGTDPNMPEIALKKAIKMLLSVAGGQIQSPIQDIYPKPISPTIFSIRYKNIHRLIGKEIPTEEIKSILLHLGIEIIAETANTLQLSVPPFKVDVTRECDIIEEILRIHGLNRVDIPQQFKIAINLAQKPNPETIQNNIADLLCNNGYYEILTNSLTKSTYHDTTTVKIVNPLSADLDAMRQNLLFSGLEVIRYNLNHKNNHLKLYEFGKTYQIEEKQYIEKRQLSIFICGQKLSEQWNHRQEEVNYFTLKGAVSAILKRLGLSSFTSENTKNIFFDEGLSCSINKKIIVEFGLVASEKLKLFGIEQAVYHASFNWEEILDLLKTQPIHFQELNKYPSVRRDLSVLIDRETNFDQLKNITLQCGKNLLKDVQIFDVYQGDKLPTGKKSYAISLTFQDSEGTLTDKTIDNIMANIIANLTEKAKIELRS